MEKNQNENKNTTLAFLEGEGIKTISSNFKLWIGGIVVVVALLSIPIMLSTVNADSPDPKLLINKQKEKFAYHEGSLKEIEYIITIIQNRISEHGNNGKIDAYHYHMGAIDELEYMNQYLTLNRWDHHDRNKKISQYKAHEIRNQYGIHASAPNEVVLSSNSLQDGTDLDKLALAVAYAETSNCKNAQWNNCHGIMHWPNGVREQRRYNSTDESFEEFKDIWKRIYGRYPDMRLAIKYTGNDRPQTWLNNVNHYYNK